MAPTCPAHHAPCQGVRLQHSAPSTGPAAWVSPHLQLYAPTCSLSPMLGCVLTGAPCAPASGPAAATRWQLCSQAWQPSGTSKPTRPSPRRASHWGPTSGCSGCALPTPLHTGGWPASTADPERRALAAPCARPEADGAGAKVRPYLGARHWWPRTAGACDLSSCLGRICAAQSALQEAQAACSSSPVCLSV